jgi:phage terminase Nu1 subunit (DNA packaging protein)
MVKVTTAEHIIMEAFAEIEKEISIFFPEAEAELRQAKADFQSLKKAYEAEDILGGLIALEHNALTKETEIAEMIGSLLDKITARFWLLIDQARDLSFDVSQAGELLDSDKNDNVVPLS